MSDRIEDLALIGDTRTSALVTRQGRIPWAAFPRFDSPACFASLIGDDSNGCWDLRPCGELLTSSRRYRGETLVLETTMRTHDGEVRLIDFMPMSAPGSSLVRIVEGVRGSVRMRSELVARFDFGFLKPWLKREDHRVVMIAGSQGLVLWSDPPMRRDDGAADLVAEFTVSEGETASFVMQAFSSHEAPPEHVDARSALRSTVRWWEDWSSRCTYDGEWREAVLRSLIVLKALTYAPTGAVVAAPTTSLPERLDGERNWDYRFCWLRDATFTVLALGNGGYDDEAGAFRDFLIRAAGGDPDKLQILYTIDGDRRAPEWEPEWLCGYQGATPVRIGNAASNQFQLDVYGEVIDAMYQAHRRGTELDETAWRLLRGLADYVVENWMRKDHGIWEARGRPRHYVYSKGMAWAALDRSARFIEEFGYDGPADRYRATCDAIRAELLDRGYDRKNRTLTRAYGMNDLDASSLLLSQIGFLPAEDARMRGTIAAIERELKDGALVWRYSASGSSELDAVPSGEGAFLACSFWLADNYVLLGRSDEARAIMEGILAIRNDVGLLSEEYDVHRQRLIGNFPQALSHLALVNTAHNITQRVGPVHQRSGTSPTPSPASRR